jgi:hypothetical protein
MMFGKTRDIHDPDTLDTSAFEGILGDERAAADAAEVTDLRERVEQMEAKVSSQFTSLATYAQIAQEQVELARAEARSQTEQSEQRVVSLIERERSDRIASLTGAPAGTAPNLTARLDALEQSVAQLRRSLDCSRQQQRELALAITTMFERFTRAGLMTQVVEAPASEPLAPPVVPMAEPLPLDHTGPIAGLALS